MADLNEEKIKLFEKLYANDTIAFKSLSNGNVAVVYPFINNITGLDFFEEQEFIRWSIKKKYG